MENLIKQAEDLIKAIRRNDKQIDNPVLVTSTIIALDDLIEYLKEEE